MWFNPIIRWLLKSPFHFFVSGSMMLMIYSGRKSGKAYETPMNYICDGNDLYTMSSHDRKWWRNLRGGEAVTLRLRGKDVSARADVFEDEKIVMDALVRVVTISPQYAKYLGFDAPGDGKLDMAAIAQAAESRVVVRSRIG